MIRFFATASVIPFLSTSHATRLAAAMPSQSASALQRASTSTLAERYRNCSGNSSITSLWASSAVICLLLISQITLSPAVLSPHRMLGSHASTAAGALAPVFVDAAEANLAGNCDMTVRRASASVAPVLFTSHFALSSALCPSQSASGCQAPTTADVFADTSAAASAACVDAANTAGNSLITRCLAAFSVSPSFCISQSALARAVGPAQGASSLQPV
mmetsp:Transcript_67012/g.160598  ORF Transcript_67012/g.160598 Transcript_67012/m.160598 type:complete len:217 (-) Transcript_67012:331-981(-)